MPNRTQHVILKGGEDLVSSGIEINPGRAQLLFNYACDANGGYSSVPGYVKYDGSSMTLTYNTGDGTAPGSGSIITVGTASAEVSSITVASGSWAGGDAAGVITITGVMSDSGVLATGAATLDDGSTCTISAVSFPAAVTGTGSIKGIALWEGDVYAFRTNVGDTADVMYVSSTSGWTAADVGYTVAFTAGGGGGAAPIPVRGDTLTQGGVTAVISGVMVTSGDFETSGNAAGNLYVHTVAGGNFSAGAATYGSGADAITLSGAQTATTFPKGTKYEFRVENFLGGASTPLLYGVSGNGRAFEYDGNAVVFINSGASTDTPNHLEVHGGRLFLSQPGGGIYFSSPGYPTTGFTQDYTAGAVYVGDECVGMRSMPGGALALFGERKTKILYGNISGVDGDMQLKDHSKLIGAKEWTVQSMNDCYFLSENGATSLYQSDKYGDFVGSGLSQGIEPIIAQSVANAIDSFLLTRTGLWRLFFSDSSADDYTFFLTATFSAGRLLGWSRGYYAFDMTAVGVGFISNDERVFAGDDAGNVFELETGKSHNGAEIRRAAILPYNPIGDVLVDKQWRKTIFQVDSSSTFDFQYSLEFNYSQTGWQGATAISDEVLAGGALWGLGTWGEFTWSGTSTYGTAELDTYGVGFNMAIIIVNTSNEIPNHTFRAFSSIYEPRRYVR